MDKIRKRYILIASASVIEGEFERMFLGKMMNILGVIDYSKAHLKIIKKESNTFILQVNLEFMGKAICATSMINEIGDKPHAFYTIKTSGTIKGIGRLIEKSGNNTKTI